MPPPERPLIPAEWKDDQRKLRDAVYDDCLQLLREDGDDEVRDSALVAVEHLEMPTGPNEPVSERLVTLLAELFQHDRNTRLRAEAVKAFRLIPNNSDVVRRVLRDGLVDPSASVQSEALAALSRQAIGGPAKLSFEEVRATLLTAITNDNSSVRLGAVRALNVFGVPAAPHIPMLERMSHNDPNSDVRESSRLAIEAIQRALHEPRK